MAAPLKISIAAQSLNSEQRADLHKSFAKVESMSDSQASFNLSAFTPEYQQPASIKASSAAPIDAKQTVNVRKEANNMVAAATRKVGGN